MRSRSGRLQSAKARRALRIIQGLFAERRQRRYGSGSGALQALLDADLSLPLLGELMSELSPSPGPLELLFKLGWQGIGSRVSPIAYRVALIQGPGARVDRLTAREFSVAELSACGWRSRRIGDALGIAGPTVRSALDRCLVKLELASAIQLPLLWHALRSPGRRLQAAGGKQYVVFELPLAPMLAPLTAAERALVERSLLGATYQGIATQRGVSMRTVANQMTRLFEKYEVSSRGELVVRLLERGGARAGPKLG